jgi:hypothetical protein
MPDPHIYTSQCTKTEGINACTTPEIPLRRSRKMEVPRAHKGRAEGSDKDGCEELMVQLGPEEVVAADAGLWAVADRA